MSLDIDPRVRAAMISDALDECGVRNQAMSEAVAPLDARMKVIGFASTLEFAADTNFDANDPYGDCIDYLDAMKAGEVAVIATGGSMRSAYWGELFSTAAQGRGALGVVTDGALRDTNEISAIGFPAFGHLTRPYDYKGRMRVKSVHTTVICGGVEVAQGDLIAADRDGVVVVPQQWIGKVVELANARARKEKTVLADLQSGMSVRAAWDAHRIL